MRLRFTGRRGPRPLTSAGRPRSWSTTVGCRESARVSMAAAHDLVRDAEVVREHADRTGPRSHHSPSVEDQRGRRPSALAAVEVVGDQQHGPSGGRPGRVAGPSTSACAHHVELGGDLVGKQDRRRVRSRWPGRARPAGPAHRRARRDRRPRAGRGLTGRPRPAQVTPRSRSSLARGRRLHGPAIGWRAPEAASRRDVPPDGHRRVEARGRVLAHPRRAARSPATAGDVAAEVARRRSFVAEEEPRPWRTGRAGSRRPSARTVRLLPAPLGPTMARTRPGCRSRPTSCTRRLSRRDRCTVRDMRAWRVRVVAHQARPFARCRSRRPCTLTATMVTTMAAAGQGDGVPLPGEQVGLGALKERCPRPVGSAWHAETRGSSGWTR